MNRCNTECALYGLLTYADWIHFFVYMQDNDYNGRVQLFGLRALKYIVEKIGVPFIENRGRRYSFDAIRGSYIIPTQIECCLQLCLIELDHVEDKDTISWEFSEQFCRFIEKNVKNSYIPDDLKLSGASKITSVSISMRKLMYGYFKYLVSWPTSRNNEMRHVIAWAVKYCGFFSERFYSIYYGDETLSQPGNVPVRVGKRVDRMNPNLKFIDSEALFKEQKEMIDMCGEVTELKKFVSVCLFVPFDPAIREHVRLLRLMLCLPMMGGFGRTDKYVVAPRTAKNDNDITNEIGSVMKENVKRLHSEACRKGFHPIKPDEWRRVTCGFYKSSASAEKERVRVSLKNVEQTVTVKSKALVGLIQGEKVFASKLKDRYDDYDSRLSTGTRDVVVKYTRTIYPVPLSVLGCQVAVTDHMVRYSLSNFGTLDPSSEFMACQISSGSSEAQGSRLLDDLDIVYYSGTSDLFIITIDYGEYDSHCTWRNFRQPIIEGLRECFVEDISDFGEVSRLDLIDGAHGPGRMHDTLWDIGREVFRTSKERLEECRKSNEWSKGYALYMSKTRKIIAPAGVNGVFTSRNVTEDVNGDLLACNVLGEDLAILSSHGSGELTTLLFNSVENMSVCDIFLNDPVIRQNLKVLVRRFVGDDMYLVCRLKDTGHMNGGILDDIKQRIFGHVKASGHVVNPQKAFFGFGFGEYRQSHCLRGSIIPKDQIAIISSEKQKNVEDVQSVLVSFKGTLMTKIARGFSIELARKIFFYVSIIMGKFSFKRLEFRRDFLTYQSLMVGGVWRDKRMKKRVIVVPNWPWFFLPGTMNGLGLHPASFLASNTESEVGSILEGFKEYTMDYLYCLKYCHLFKWYRVEAELEHVEALYGQVDGKFLSDLVPETTRLVQNAAKQSGYRPWWDDVPRQMIKRAVMMEQRLLGRDYISAERNAADVVIKIISALKRELDYNKASDKELDLITNNVFRNNGFIYGYEFLVESETLGRMLETGEIPMDIFLDGEALCLRIGFGYGQVDSKSVGCKMYLDRAISRDPVMRNVITAEGLLRRISEFDVDVYAKDVVAIIIMGMGFSQASSEIVTDGLLNIMEYGGLLMIRDNGLLADEFTMSLGSRSRLKHGELTFHCRMAQEEKVSMNLALMCREIIYYIQRQKRFTNVRVTKRILPGENRGMALYLSRKRNMFRPSSRVSVRALLSLASSVSI
uniref:RNA-directed RNA polymerase n=1 Tax=Mops bat reovirus TaxID=3141894 RepID=A0AAU7E235_9REOV